MFMTGHERTLVTSCRCTTTCGWLLPCALSCRSSVIRTVYSAVWAQFHKTRSVVHSIINGSRVKRRERKGSVLACGAARRYLF